MLTYMHILSLCSPLLYYPTASNLSFKADHTGGQRFSLFIQTNFITFFFKKNRWGINTFTNPIY